MGIRLLRRRRSPDAAAHGVCRPAGTRRIREKPGPRARLLLDGLLPDAVGADDEREALGGRRPHLRSRRRPDRPRPLRDDARAGQGGDRETARDADRRTRVCPEPDPGRLLRGARLPHPRHRDSRPGMEQPGTARDHRLRLRHRARSGRALHAGGRRDRVAAALR